MGTRNIVRSVLIVGSLIYAGGALAQSSPAYTAADVEKHFAAAKHLEAKYGQSRAVCIGTDSECSNAAAPAAKQAPGFDLLVNFNYNSDVLTPVAQANLQEFARALKANSLASASFVVEGHTDAKGSDRFNLDLSARRADAVVHFLEQHGVSAKRLVAKAYGKARPRVTNPDDPVNRRVEARLSAP